MPLACPVCGADNDAGPACRRCRADLGLCFAVEAQRDDTVAAALVAAVADRMNDALALVESAAVLRRGPDTEQLLATLHLVARDFAGAWTLWFYGNSATPRQNQ
jgi:hypothetical protein